MMLPCVTAAHPKIKKKNQRDLLALNLIVKFNSQMFFDFCFLGRVAVMQGKQCCLDLPVNSEQYQDNVKGTTSWFTYLEKFSLNFSSLSLAICVNLFHP